MNLIGAPITSAILYGAAALVAVLVGIILTLGGGLWWQSGALEEARQENAQLVGKNARCEAEGSRLKGSLDTQSAAVKDVKAACEVAGKVAEDALKVAQGNRPVTAREIANIMAGKPSDPNDLCRSACVEMRKELRR